MACSTSGTSRTLDYVVDGQDVTFEPTALGNDTYSDADGDNVVIDVWLESIVSVTGVTVEYGRGSGIEYPSWLVHNKALLASSGRVSITIKLSGVANSVDTIIIGIRADDGVNPVVDDYFCFDTPYEPPS